MLPAQTARGDDRSGRFSGPQVGFEGLVKPDVVAILEAVKRWQSSDHVHPLTCGIESTHRPLVAIEAEEHQVVLRCLDCDYRQTHIPDIVLKGVPKLPKHIKKQIEELNPERGRALSRVPDLYEAYRAACEEYLRQATTGDTDVLFSEARLRSIQDDIEKTIASLLKRGERSNKKRRATRSSQTRRTR